MSPASCRLGTLTTTQLDTRNLNFFGSSDFSWLVLRSGKKSRFNHADIEPKFNYLPITRSIGEVKRTDSTQDGLLLLGSKYRMGQNDELGSKASERLTKWSSIGKLIHGKLNQKSRLTPYTTEFEDKR